MDSNSIDRLQALVSLIGNSQSSSLEFKLGMLLEKVTQLINAFKAQVAENADLKTQLAEALADDAADEAAIAEAQAAAEEARVRAESLQVAVDADLVEDSEITAAIDAVLPQVVA